MSDYEEIEILGTIRKYNPPVRLGKTPDDMYYALIRLLPEKKNRLAMHGNVPGINCYEKEHPRRSSHDRAQISQSDSEGNIA